jgi:outer membrane protein
MRRPRPLFLALLLAVLPTRGPSAEESAVRLSLAETIDRARQGSARLAQLLALETAAEAGVRGARAGRLPQVDVSASYTRQSNVPELVLAIPGLVDRTIFPNIPDNYRTHAGLSLPVYTGSRVESGIAAAAEQRRAAGKDLQAAAGDVVLEASIAYWSLVAARESARVLQESVAAFEAHLKDAKNRLDYGMAARNEVLAVQVERDRSELGRLQAANASEVANANLLRLLGLPPESRVEPTEPMALPPGPPAATEALLAAATAKRPEILALRSRIAAADANVKIARSAFLPQASISGGFDYANPNPRILPLAPQWNGTWSAGLTLSLTAFDGGRTAAAVAQAQAQAQAARHQLDDLERHIRLEVTTRVLDLATARAAIEVSNRNLEAAKENVRVARDRYEEGVIPSSELLDAETALLHAGLDQTTTATELQVAVANLDRAVVR